MTKDEALEELEKLSETHGINSQEYRTAYGAFVEQWGSPERGIKPPGDYTNGGSHGIDNNFFGKNERDEDEEN